MGGQRGKKKMRKSQYLPREKTASGERVSRIREWSTISHVAKRSQL